MIPPADESGAGLLEGAPAATAEPAETPRGRRRLPPLSLAIAVPILLALVVGGIFGGWIAPYDATEFDLAQRLAPPAWHPDGTSAHLLGTDSLGRDLLSRILIGTRVSLLVSLAALSAGAVVGTALGLLAGYKGGLVDAVIMRLVDAAIGFPMIFIALLFVAIVGPHPLNVIISVAAVLWSRFARVIRSEVLELRERQFIASARVSGVGTLTILVRHLLPNILNTLVVMASLQMGWVILVEASLSFLGAGIPPPAPAWGAMVADGRDLMTSAWWVPTFPGLAILLTVLALNLMGDWLRDRLDPKLRQL